MELDALGRRADAGMAPIPGMRRIERLDENLGSSTLQEPTLAVVVPLLLEPRTSLPGRQLRN
ncbi:hypothetical protein [Terrabacter sp. C0L_2]|uniref:hypothetical protein n=1 Tax=Terrabacter sp. C0L_2 TaxID=3108389 RepID=UPI002ED0B52B|nr:hypothetical protein U5C87_22490 [Terrabacter sp. C0L_2]